MQLKLCFARCKQFYNLKTTYGVRLSQSQCYLHFYLFICYDGNCFWFACLYFDILFFTFLGVGGVGVIAEDALYF